MEPTTLSISEGMSLQPEINSGYVQSDSVSQYSNLASVDLDQMSPMVKASPSKIPYKFDVTQTEIPESIYEHVLPSKDGGIDTPMIGLEAGPPMVIANTSKLGVALFIKIENQDHRGNNMKDPKVKKFAKSGLGYSSQSSILEIGGTFRSINSFNY